MCVPSPLRILTALTVVLLQAPGETTQHETEGASDSSVLTLGPRYVLDFGSKTGIPGLVFLKDGTSLFLASRCRAVNVWTVIVHYWPELLTPA